MTLWPRMARASHSSAGTEQVLLTWFSIMHTADTMMHAQFFVLHDTATHVVCTWPLARFAAAAAVARWQVPAQLMQATERRLVSSRQISAASSETQGPARPGSDAGKRPGWRFGAVLLCF